MEGDDEFGDLYTDVLLQFQPSPSLPPAPKPSIDPILPSHDHENDDVLFPLTSPPNPNPNPDPNPNPNLSFSLSLPPDTNRNWNQDPARDEEVLADGVGTKPRVLEGVGKDAEKNEGLVDEEENFERFDIEEAEEIPGVSNRQGEGNNDWESESDDDLNIVLNESNHGGVVVEGFGDGEDDGGGDDDDDDDDPLVIVADSDPGHVPMEEREWGEDAGERKEVGEGAKGNGGGTVVCAPKIGFTRSFTYQPYHSQFKVSYVVQSGVIQV